MSDAALQMSFWGRRDVTGRPPTPPSTLAGDGSDPIASLRSFAAILLGTTPFDPSREAIAHATMAAGLAADRLRRARETPSEKRLHAHPYRTLYQLAKDQAVAVKPREATGGSKSERVLCALLGLRHRQRAALALRFLMGLDEIETGFVLGLSKQGTSEVLKAALAAAARAAGEGLDVSASLRAVRTKLRTAERAAPPEPAAATAVMSDPAPKTAARSVVRRLLAVQPQGASPTIIRSARLMPTVLPRPIYRVRDAIAVAAVPAAESPIALEPAPALPGSVPAAPAPALPIRPVPQRRSGAWRVAAAAAAVLFLGLAFLPSVNRGITRPPPLAAIPLGPAVVRATAPARQAGPAIPAYVVRPGDTLWSISQRVLGEPGRWRQIWRANSGRAMPGGSRFLDPNLILPGWRLTMPRG